MLLELYLDVFVKPNLMCGACFAILLQQKCVASLQTGGGSLKHLPVFQHMNVHFYGNGTGSQSQSWASTCFCRLRFVNSVFPQRISTDLRAGEQCTFSGRESKVGRTITELCVSLHSVEWSKLNIDCTPLFSPCSFPIKGMPRSTTLQTQHAIGGMHSFQCHTHFSVTLLGGVERITKTQPSRMFYSKQ